MIIESSLSQTCPGIHSLELALTETLQHDKAARLTMLVCSFSPAHMPRVRKLECEVHDEAECQCYKQSIPVAQSLEELDYLKSACAAAQQGNEAKLHVLLEKHPEAINSDGSEGMFSTDVLGSSTPALTACCHFRRHRLYTATLCCQGGPSWRSENASGKGCGTLA